MDDKAAGGVSFEPEILETAVYGIWLPQDGTVKARWHVQGNPGIVFHTLRLAVAQAQCQHIKSWVPDAEVKRMVAE